MATRQAATVAGSGPVIYEGWYWSPGVGSASGDPATCDQACESQGLECDQEANRAKLDLINPCAPGDACPNNQDSGSLQAQARANWLNITAEASANTPGHPTDVEGWCNPTNDGRWQTYQTVTHVPSFRRTSSPVSYTHLTLPTKA